MGYIGQFILGYGILPTTLTKPHHRFCGCPCCKNEEDSMKPLESTTFTEVLSNNPMGAICCHNDQLFASKRHAGNSSPLR